MIGSKAICHIGLVVHDIEKTGQAFADFFGVEKPDAIGAGDPAITQLKYMGQDSTANRKMMFFQLENFQIELIEPDAQPSVWRDVLDEKGEGIHHIAFEVKGIKDHMKRLEAKGYPTTQCGNYGNGSGMYAYLDTTNDLKMIVELLESF